MSVEIAHPFRAGSDGQIAVTSDPDLQVRQHVLALVNTAPSERLMLSRYGVSSQQFLFEPATDEIPIQLGLIIEAALTAWEPGVAFEAATIPPSDQFGEENLERVEIHYSRKDSPDASQVVGTNTATVSAGGTVKESIRG